MTLRHELSDYAHEAWSGWMQHLFDVCEKNENGTVTIPKSRVERWMRQIQTPYENLSQEEQNSDNVEADRIIEILQKHYTL